MSDPSRRPGHGGAGASAADSALAAIERLRRIVEAENEQIARGGLVDYEAGNLRKSQGLLELDRLRPVLATVPPGAPLRAAFCDLQAILEINRERLGTQLMAARTVANLIARTIREGQSDGTYSARSWIDDEE
jgi:hypothetical protein